LVYLSLWWSGRLESGIWQIEASWPGQSLYGNFIANVRRLPEISLIEPRFETVIFSDVSEKADYACHLVTNTDSYWALLENFLPNAVVSIPIYHESFYFDLEKVYQTAVRTDKHGNAKVELDYPFEAGQNYFIFGVPDELTTIADEYNYINFSSIANAMDCFTVP
jgi:hypothetical protein